MTVHDDAGDSGALFKISGTVSNNSTWDEPISFYSGGAALDISGLAFELQFRNDSFDRSASVTLSTAAGDLTLVGDSGGVTSILRINVPYTRISSLCGDCIADLVSKDGDDKLVHWGHGIVTFRQAPVAF